MVSRMPRYCFASAMAAATETPRTLTHKSKISPLSPLAKSAQTPALAPDKRTDSDCPASPLRLPAFHSPDWRLPPGSRYCAIAAASPAMR